VETYLCSNPTQLSYVLEHLPELVVKAVGESGGYGMLMGPSADKKTIEDFRLRLIDDPRNYIAQPVIPLSRCPAFDAVTGCMSPRHVDLRPYCLYDGEKVTIVPGGLTRVALQRGSLVVNSSQGGGSKDTWVLRHNSSDQAVESEEYLEWVGLLKSCAAFEAYCKTYTAEVRPLRVCEFLLLNPSFPHSVRFSVDMVHASLTAIEELTGRKAEQPVRLAGRLRANLSFSHIDEIMGSGANAFVEGIRWQCAQVHNSIHQIYFDYPVESALVS
jgi:hypothetical protein